MLKLPAIYEELSSISVIDFKSVQRLLLLDDLLEQALVGHDLYGDMKALAFVQVMNLTVIETR